MRILNKQYREALAALDRVRELNAEKSGHFYFRAVVLEHLGDHAGAVASYSRFLATSAGENPADEYRVRRRLELLQRALAHATSPALEAVGPVSIPEPMRGTDSNAAAKANITYVEARKA
jgi:hypothetical protein